MGGRAEGFIGLQGAGDLYVTCTGGRTFRLGWLMGKGLTYSQAQAEMREDTLEGAFAVLQMAKVLPIWEAAGPHRAGRSADAAGDHPCDHDRHAAGAAVG